MTDFDIMRISLFSNTLNRVFFDMRISHNSVIIDSRYIKVFELGKKMNIGDAFSVFGFSDLSYTMPNKTYKIIFAHSTRATAQSTDTK